MSPTQADPTTAVEMWTRRVAESGPRIAFRHKQDGLWQGITWSEADAAAREIAAGLVAAGVQPGDRVCLLSQTRVEWMLCDVGILLAGAVNVPIYASNTPDQCAYIVREVGARLVIVEDAAQLDKILSVRAGLGASDQGPLQLVHLTGDATLDRPDARGRKQVLLADIKPAGDTSVRSLVELREAGKRWLASNGRGLDDRVAGIGPDSMFTIIYTSGTTGVPKGVVLSHRNLATGVASACRAMVLYPDDEQLLFVPMAHVLGREVAWVPVQVGFATWYAESILKLKDNLVESRPTFMAAVPRVYEKFYAAVQAGMKQGSPTKQKLVAWAFDVGARVAAADREDRSPGLALSTQRVIADALVLSKLRAKLGLDRCRFLISGSAPLAADICEFFERAKILILEGYGLTETTAAAFLNRLEDFRFGTVGPALDVVEMKIADDGEILMRGPSVFHEYYKNPEATAEVIDADGWFHSGDIGVLEDEFLRITDRKKDLIVTAGGKKVAPQPIENAIKSRCPLVGQVVVFGDKRPYCVALMTPSEEALKRFGRGDGSNATVDVVALRNAVEPEVAAVNAGLAPYETIKTFAVLPAEFTEATGELTPSMKVKRKVVSEKYRDVLESLYAQVKAD